MTELKNLNCDNSKTQIVTVVIVTVVTIVVLVTLYRLAPPLCQILLKDIFFLNDMSQVTRDT